MTDEPCTREDLEAGKRNVPGLLEKVLRPASGRRAV